MSSSRSPNKKTRKQENLPSYTRDPILPIYEDENHDSAVSSSPRPQPLRRLLSLQRQEERDLELGNIERTPLPPSEDIYMPPEFTGEINPCVPGSALSASTAHVLLTRASRARAEGAARSSNDEDMTPLQYAWSQPETPTVADAAAAAPEAATPVPENHPELTSASRARLEGAASASRGEDLPPLRYYWSHPDTPGEAVAPAKPAASASVRVPVPTIISRFQIQIVHRVRRSFKAMGAYSLLMIVLVVVALGIAVVAWEALKPPTSTL